MKVSARSYGLGSRFRLGLGLGLELELELALELGYEDMPISWVEGAAEMIEKITMTIVQIQEFQ